jgi:hypothetical protein
MPSRALTALKLYVPLVITAGLLIALWRLNDFSSSTTVAFQPVAMLAISVPIRNALLLRLLLGAGSLACLSTYLFYDYARFFPTFFKMEVFFDPAGLDASIVALHVLPGDAVTLVDNFAAHRQRYFSVVDGVVASLGRVPTFFAVNDGSIHSLGHTSFVVEKVAGWQRYHLAEARGELQHTLEHAGSPQSHLLSFFEKIPSRDDYFSLSHRHPFRMILRSQFKQMLATDRDGPRSTFRFVVVGLTRVSIWPWPTFSNTVYCADFESVGLVPVAYAVYC